MTPLLDRPSATDADRELRADLVGRAAKLVPMLARNAQQPEDGRRVVEENITAIDEAGLLSLVRSKRFGGLEVDFRAKLEVTRELGWGCGSTAWTVSLLNVCSWFTGLWSAQAQQDVWGEHPANRAAGVFAPTATAEVVDGDYMVSGSWGWASGCLYAQWSLVSIPILEADGELIDQGLILIPNTELAIEDTWFVTGMKSTGSNTLVAENVFVPEHRFLSIFKTLQGEVDTPFKDEALYRAAFVPGAAIILAGPQLGLPQATLGLVLMKAPSHREESRVRIGNLAGRLSLFTDGGAVDVERASSGRFGSDPQAVYDRWGEFVSWATGAPLSESAPFKQAELGAPVPAPAQVFAIGLNYRDHAAESKLDAPDGFPPVFTKFRTALSGPITTVALPAGGHTDWEVELVAVIGRRAYQVTEADGWSHVAGLMVGQDLSERISQLAGPAPQFSLGKSYPGFAPTGPYVVTPDELVDPDDLELGCAVNGESMQKGRTSDLLFPVATLVQGLSAVTPLLPGDLIFTGTPAGVGVGRNPQRFLRAGEELVSYVTGIGELRQRFTST